MRSVDQRRARGEEGMVGAGIAANRRGGRTGGVDGPERALDQVDTAVDAIEVGHADVAAGLAAVQVVADFLALMLVSKKT